MQLAECGSVSFMQFDGDVVCTRQRVVQRGVTVLCVCGCVGVCGCQNQNGGHEQAGVQTASGKVAFCN